MFAVCVDVSDTAIRLLLQRAAKVPRGPAQPASELNPQDSIERRVQGFVCNVATEPLPPAANSVDFVLMIFVLSAIPPARHLAVAKSAFEACRPGGLVCFRDYGAYDMTMMRSKAAQVVRPSGETASGGGGAAPRLFRRADGTLRFFFELGRVAELFSSCGFVQVSCEYCTVHNRNRKTGTLMRRVFVNAKFRRPLEGKAAYSGAASQLLSLGGPALAPTPPDAEKAVDLP